MALSLGEKIILLRQNNDMKQSVLSEQIGVTKSMLSKYENNINIPKADILGKIADSLNTTTDYLLGRTDNLAPLSTDNYLVKISPQEHMLLLSFQSLSKSRQARVLERIDVLIEEQSHRKRST